MKKTVFPITLLLLLFIVFTSSVNSDARGIKVINVLSHGSGKLGAYRALIIGINDYKDPKIPDLETAVNDAKAMAELLRERYGFQCKLLLDRKATKGAIYRTLRNLVSTAKQDDSVLIYYAGHGDLDRTYNDGWWIPSDAEGGNPLTYLDNVQVQKAMRSMQARHVLLVSDSCYAGTLFGQGRSLPPIIDDKYYLNLYNEKSRWGMTSGNRTPVSDQGSGGHSVFAYQLLKELRKNKKPYLSTQEIYTRIAPIVGNNSEQTPICRPIRNTGDKGGSFIFVDATHSANTTKTMTVENFISSSHPLSNEQKQQLYEIIYSLRRACAGVYHESPATMLVCLIEAKKGNEWLRDISFDEFRKEYDTVMNKKDSFYKGLLNLIMFYIYEQKIDVSSNEMNNVPYVQSVGSSGIQEIADYLLRIQKEYYYSDIIKFYKTVKAVGIKNTYIRNYDSYSELYKALGKPRHVTSAEISVKYATHYCWATLPNSEVHNFWRKRLQSLPSLSEIF